MAKKKIDPVIEECCRVQGIRDLDEGAAALGPLWEEHIAQEKFLSSSLSRVEAIAYARFWLEWRREDYLAALGCLEVLFAHPDIEEINPHMKIHYLLMQMECHLGLGEIDQAVETAWKLFALEKRRDAMYIMRYNLMMYVADQDPAAVAPEPLVNVVWEVFQALKKRRKREQKPLEASYGYLSVLLEATESAETIDQRQMMRRLCQLANNKANGLNEAEQEEAVQILTELTKGASEEERQKRIASFLAASAQ
jgi:hypothetical protein